MDLFCSEYGWSIKQTFGHTCNQIIRLQKKIRERQINDKKASANILRASYHANASGFSSLLNSLEGQNVESIERAMYIPEGMVKNVS